MNAVIVLIMSVVAVLTACAPAPAVTVDPKLAPYFASFTKDIGVPTDGISAKFTTTTNQITSLGEVVADCVISSSDDSRTINVDPIYWTSLGEYGKIQLMYHELGHCAMNLGHVTELNVGECPVSIMYPLAFGDTYCFTGDVQGYYQELRSHN